MISIINSYIQPQEKTFSVENNVLAERYERPDSKGDAVIIRRRIEHKSMLEIRFARLKRVMRIRSTSII